MICVESKGGGIHQIISPSLPPRFVLSIPTPCSLSDSYSLTSFFTPYPSRCTATPSPMSNSKGPTTWKPRHPADSTSQVGSATTTLSTKASSINPGRAITPLHPPPDHPDQDQSLPAVPVNASTSIGREMSPVSSTWV